MKNKLLISSIFLYIVAAVSIPASAEDIKKTVKYKPPTMDQTVGFIQGIMTNFGGFEPGDCTLTSTAVINSVAYEYNIPLRELDPSFQYVKTRLSCVTLSVPGNKKIITRTGRDNKEAMKQKVDICTENQESAKKLATAMRYLISICSGKDCTDCPAFPWEGQ